MKRTAMLAVLLLLPFTHPATGQVGRGIPPAGALVRPRGVLTRYRSVPTGPLYRAGQPVDSVSQQMVLRVDSTVVLLLMSKRHVWLLVRREDAPQDRGAWVYGGRADKPLNVEQVSPSGVKEGAGRDH